MKFENLPSFSSVGPLHLEETDEDPNDEKSLKVKRSILLTVNALTDQGKTWTHLLKHYLSLQLYFQDQNVWIRMLVYHLRWVDII